ncbi:xanthine dehydrogenase/oxidase-like [Anneissia japonica]|uniref:xanthine dehydrogenase/oxidase-like n=1 Tax=Anneissia japonica TaxID=1529436 RepID=UPI001425B1AA|nr:xanthine dehydrogenase/oxidase-like [Anneissia japonica]
MSTDQETQFIFFCNGRKITDNSVDPSMMLLSYLRLKLRLTGSKLGCGEGGCGACTVMVSSYDKATKKISHISVNACLTPICQIHMMAVTTVEGIGSLKTGLHPVQERIAKSHGSQCGFCTPGIVMSMYTLLRNNHQPTMSDVEDTFQGNLCRCTGYRPILEGFRTFTKNNDFTDTEYLACNGGTQCCRSGGGINGISKTLFQPSKFTAYDPSTEIIFPPELILMLENEKPKLLRFTGEDVTWLRPTNLHQLFDIRKQFPNSKLVSGNTELGVDVNLKKVRYPILVSLTHITELNTVESCDVGVKIGASVTLSRIEEFLSNAIKKIPDHKCKSLFAIVDMLHWFAGQQIRNVASIGGNIITGSPISDLNPIFMASGCTLEVVDTEGVRRLIPIVNKFFTGYRTNSMKPNEILISVTVPYTNKSEHFKAFKQAHRRDDDIAIVNAAFRVDLQDEVIQSCSMVFGGMAPTTKLAKETMSKIIGRTWDQSLLEDTTILLADEMSLPPDAPGGMVEYRQSLVLSFFFKFYLTVRQHCSFSETILLADEMSLPPDAPGGMVEYRQSLVLSFFFKFYLTVRQHCSFSENKCINIQSVDMSATLPFKRADKRSTQMFQEIPDNQSSVDPVGRPMVHSSAYQQATGEAVYIDDIVPFQDELYMAIVFSQKAHAIINDDLMQIILVWLLDVIYMLLFFKLPARCVDATAALRMPGVYAFIDHNDVTGSNFFGELGQGEELFATVKVTCVGQYIGGIVADNKEIAQRAARMVRVEYQELEPIISIEDAIAKGSYLQPIRTLRNGNVSDGYNNSDQIIKGEIKLGEQEHFYLETQTGLALPKREDNVMEILSSCQDQRFMQARVANVLGVQFHKITVRVKRLGGGFGGKETRCWHLSAALAVAAKRVGRPVRCMLDRGEDMSSTGTRHAFLGRYKVGFTNEGKIQALEIDLYSNSGNSQDSSISVMECAMLRMQNAYYIPNVTVRGYCCKTNIPSNTAFRGFGTPQALMMTENWISDIALACGISQRKVREINMLQDGESTYCNQKVQDLYLIKRCWNECLNKSDYEMRQLQVNEFNRSNRWKKRGISIIPLSYGVGFHAKFLNQAGALVIIYTDGSVLLTHGGVEMGQGLHTKMIQVASRTLGIASNRIYTNENSTSTVPNTSQTAASVGSDLNGMAVKIACEKLCRRLEPYRNREPSKTWDDWVKAAYYDRVSLSATGFYKTPDIGYEWDTKSGEPFYYFSFGAAVSEVEIDCLTGDHMVLRTDIVMDVGDTINPAIDIGQIEGAFIQGYGLFTLEEHRWSPTGNLLTKGPGFYKLPGFTDIPVEFNVSLLDGVPNKKVVCSSKAIGEPPLCLAISVFYAIKEAIFSSRRDSGIEGSFRLDSPATAERIRMACVDKFTGKFPSATPGTFTPFFIRS